ncbi:MAG: type II CAAX endopeptidase family protein [Clostridiaceae bacterium]|nr:type II CAAX endopeptidase family protein [Clostridiaceae bacterium]
MKKMAVRLGWSLFILALVTDVVEILVGLFIQRFYPVLAQSEWFSAALIAIGFYLCGLPVFALLTRKIKGWNQEGNHVQLRFFGQVVPLYFACMFLGYVFSLLGVLINLFVSHFTGITPSNPISDMISFSGLVPMIVVAGVLSPIVEEFIFRGIVIDKTLKYGENAAIWFSAITFGLIHMNLYQFFYAVAIGIILGYVRVKTGKIKYSIMLHIMVNMTGSVLIPVLSAIKNIGEYLVGTFIALVMILGFIYWRRLKKTIRAEEDSARSCEETISEEQDAYTSLCEDQATPNAKDLYLNIGTLAYIGLCIAGFVYSIVA